LLASPKFQPSLRLRRNSREIVGRFRHNGGMSELLTNLERLSPIDRATGDDTLWQGAKHTSKR
jgi:hypothetical protein